MKHIGKYQGTPCYECNDREYKDALSRDKDNGEQIFIIDGTMVRRNIIIGYYDGKSVADMKKELAGHINTINKKLPSFKHMTATEVRFTEFEKTSSRKIKRFKVQ